jgi:hypothetical protein
MSTKEADRAERLQAWKAFLIPSGLFVACLFNAAGIYIVSTGNSVGIVFMVIGLAIISAGLIMFITFQNKQRAKGQWKQVSEPEPYMPPSSQRRSRSSAQGFATADNGPTTEELREEAKV